MLIETDSEIESTISKALDFAKSDKVVLVDVNIDYQKRTRFTKDVVKTILKKFPLSDKVRFIGRTVKRKILG
jgi:acetolactate synthase-1/2/3 large subunit